jgi:hypothetical protein
MTHGRLGQAQRFGEVTGAGLAVRGRHQQRQQPQPGRIGQRLESAGSVFGLLLGQHGGAQRWTAVGGRQQGERNAVNGHAAHPELRHRWMSILTVVDETSIV